MIIPSPYIVLAGLASQALADGIAIVSAIGAISNSTIKLNTTVARFPTSAFLDIFAIGPLLVDSIAVLKDINDGTDIATASTNLTLTETLAVAGATQNLVTTVTSTLNTLVLAKPMFDKLLVVTPVVFLNLKAQLEATVEFGDAVVEKIPAAYQGLAVLVLEPVLVAFNSTIEIYEGLK